MIKIEIDHAEAIEKISKKTQKPYYKQFAWAYLVDQTNKKNKYPTKISLFVPVNEHGRPLVYKPGFYSLHVCSIGVDQFDGLEIGRTQLIPLEEKTAA